MFDRGAGEALGIDFTDLAAPRRWVSIAGKERQATSGYVTLTLPMFRDLYWSAEVWFFLEEWEMPFGILGNEGFLDKWVVSFNRYRNYFVVEPIDEFEGRAPADPYEEFQKLDADWDPESND